MIDTNKYEGHTEGPWRIVCWERQWYIEGDYEEGQEDCTAREVCYLYGTAQRKDPTSRLIADAPLLLAEVKRLREEIHEMGITLHDLGYRWDEETGEMYHRDDTRRDD